MQTDNLNGSLGYVPMSSTTAKPLDLPLDTSEIKPQIVNPTLDFTPNITNDQYIQALEAQLLAARNAQASQKSLPVTQQPTQQPTQSIPEIPQDTQAIPQTVDAPWFDSCFAGPSDDFEETTERWNSVIDAALGISREADTTTLGPVTALEDGSAKTMVADGIADKGMSMGNQVTPLVSSQPQRPTASFPSSTDPTLLAASTGPSESSTLPEKHIFHSTTDSTPRPAKKRRTDGCWKQPEELVYFSDLPQQPIITGNFNDDGGQQWDLGLPKFDAAEGNGLWPLSQEIGSGSQPPNPDLTYQATEIDVEDPGFSSSSAIAAIQPPANAKAWPKGTFATKSLEPDTFQNSAPPSMPYPYNYHPGNIYPPNQGGFNPMSVPPPPQEVMPHYGQMPQPMTGMQQQYWQLPPPPHPPQPQTPTLSKRDMHTMAEQFGNQTPARVGCSDHMDYTPQPPQSAPKKLPKSKKPSPPSMISTPQMQHTNSPYYTPHTIPGAVRRNRGYMPPGYPQHPYQGYGPPAVFPQSPNDDEGEYEFYVDAQGVKVFVSSRDTDSKKSKIVHWTFEEEVFLRWCYAEQPQWPHGKRADHMVWFSGRNGIPRVIKNEHVRILRNRNSIVMKAGRLKLVKGRRVDWEQEKPEIRSLVAKFRSWFPPKPEVLNSSGYAEGAGPAIDALGNRKIAAAKGKRVNTALQTQDPNFGMN